MDLVALIGLISSVLGIVSFFVALKGWQHKTYHVVYGILLLTLGGGLLYTQTQASGFQRDLAQVRDIERQAERLSKAAPSFDDGARRGYVLTGLTFLEKHRDRYPDTYSRAVKFAEAAGVLTTTGNSYTEEQRAKENLKDAANAIQAQLIGISLGAATDWGK